MFDSKKQVRIQLPRRGIIRDVLFVRSEMIKRGFVDCWEKVPQIIEELRREGKID